MWVIEGAFDGDSGNLDQKKTKLLKPGKAYPLGRKAKYPLQIVLAHPKISAEHVTFAVGDHTVSDVSDTRKYPSLVLRNHRDKTLLINRDFNNVRERVGVQPKAEIELCSGDTIALVSELYVSVHWRPFYVLCQTNISNIPLEKCASLGVKIVSTLRSFVTHYIASEFAYTPGLIASLLIPAQIVRFDWLTELLHLGESSSPENLSQLEIDFHPPMEPQYRPSCSPEILPLHQIPEVWEPMPERKELLRGWRILFVGEKGREVDSSTRFLVETGGGEYEVFDVEGGPTRLKQALTRNARKANGDNGKRLSIIGDANRLRIAAGVTWDSVLDVLDLFLLRIVHRQALFDAVLQNNVMMISSSTNVDETVGQYSTVEELQAAASAVQDNRQEQPFAESVAPMQNVSSDERRTSGTPELTLRKRVASSTESGAADLGEEGLQGSSHKNIVENGPGIPERSQALGRTNEESETGRRKPLVRRAGTKFTPVSLFGADDSVVVEAEPAVSENNSFNPSVEPERPRSTSTGPSARPGRLKKRVRGDTPLNPIIAELEAELFDVPTSRAAEERPFKRFKALFEETDPDRLESQAIKSGNDGQSGVIVESQIFSQKPTETAGSKDTHSPLSAIPEENGEDRVEAVVQEVGMADTAPAIADMLVTDANSSTQDISEEAREKAPLDRQPSSARFAKPLGSRRHGAIPGEHDTDDAFLKALSSTKKGKRREDAFDREFNNLRISKPEIEKESEDWNVLADFGDETNLRGNFMVIVEMEVPEKQDIRAQSRETERAEWAERQNFKKFKKTSLCRSHARSSVELVVDNENDFGIGTVYWKDGSQSQSQSQDNSEVEPPPLRPGHLKQSQTQNQTQIRNILRPSTSKPSSDIATRDPSMQPMSRFKSRKQKQFESEVDDFNDAESVGKASSDKRGTRRGRKAGGSQGAHQPLFLDALDEEDEDEVGLDNGSTASAAKALTIGEDMAEVELNLKLDEDDFSDDESIPTLRSTARSAGRGAMSKSRSTASRGKRAAKLLDDESGDTFKGFSGRKRTRVT